MPVTAATVEAEEGRPWVEGQPGLHSDNLPQNREHSPVSGGQADPWRKLASKVQPA